MSKTFFDNTKNTKNSGFITFTFNGGIDGQIKSQLDEKGLMYLYVVNGLQPVGGNGEQKKTFSQTEFVFKMMLIGTSLLSRTPLLTTLM